MSEPTPYCHLIPLGARHKPTKRYRCCGIVQQAGTWAVCPICACIYGTCGPCDDCHGHRVDWSEGSR